MDKDFVALDLVPLVQEIAKGAQIPKPPVKAIDDEITERVFIGDDGAELEILRWSQDPYFIFD